ncbi:Cyclin A [Klebsormidium nitens]|uniref:Cyclin A n=1 Tax=Klebsormidium nitens TaxID=105231 RepID=A0A1Y1HW95_KLENI|nr:Cyclin A [Klebsormidium nitens]|eukprot:GAQ82905.1 Cyclin A [Klebsormidium nitens]
MNVTSARMVCRKSVEKVAKGGPFGGSKGPSIVSNESDISGVTVAETDNGQYLQSHGVMTRGQKRKAETSLSEEPSCQRNRPATIPTPSSCQWSSQNEPGSTKVFLKRERVTTDFYPRYGVQTDIAESTCSSAVIGESVSGPASVPSQRSSHLSRQNQKPPAQGSLEVEPVAGSSGVVHLESSEAPRSELCEDEDDLQFLRSEEEDVDCLLADESQSEDGSPDRRGSDATYYDAPEQFRDQEASTSRNQEWYFFEQCGDYEESIFLNLKEREQRHPPLGHYLEHRGTDITADHRAIMINWLVEFVAEFNLQMETLFLSVAIMDKFLSEGRLLKKSSLQLLGIASLFLAVKLEETQPPCMVNDFCEVTNLAFNKEQIIEMEGTILNSLKFTLFIPTAYNFIWRHLKFVERPTQEKDNFAEYLIGLALLDYDMLEYPASLVAASAVSLACYSIDTKPKHQSKKQILEALWPAAIASESGYSRTDLTPCLKTLHELHKGVYYGRRLEKLTALAEKYQNQFKDGVALTKPVDLPTWL